MRRCDFLAAARRASRERELHYADERENADSRRRHKAHRPRRCSLCYFTPAVSDVYDEKHFRTPPTT